ncbi:MAG: MBL fold metallo-hydrolase [Candidatus Heimdallarchaeota archaeon]|nr:MAG: MBL fold metallo-hydrolase [Candidatus Heimdallarchaeota archaeon]
METEIILLGTGTPIPDPERFGSSLAIKSNQKVYIIDFGPGVVRRAVAAGIKPSQMTKAFLTHMHSDHTTGYPDLIFTPAVEGRKQPLEVYGPQGLESMTNHILAAYKMDIEERDKGLEPTSMDGYEVNVHEVKSGVVYTDERLKVEAIYVKHGSWPAFGFKFITLDKSIVISGDTAPTPKFIQFARNCDVLLHEVYSTDGLTEREPEWIRYHSAYHTSSYELGDIATKIKPKLLILYHQLFMGRKEMDLLNEVREVYSGEVISGKDLDVF